jgi:MFS family permease
MTALTVLSSTIAQTRILPRTGAKPLITVGMALGVVAMVLLTRLSPGSGYAAGVLPSLIVLGLGLGMIFAPAIGTATLGVNRSDAGVASAMVNTSQQIGGSVGTALLSTLFASSASAFARTHAGVHGLQAAAQVHGYTTAFWWSAGIFALGLLIAVVVFPMRVKPTEPALAAESAGGAELALSTE